MKGYYLLCVDVKKQEEFKDIGIAVEKAAALHKEKMERLIYWFSTDGKQPIELIKLFEEWK